MNCDYRMTPKQVDWACFEILFQHLSERKWGGRGEKESKDIRDKLQTQLQNTEIYHGNK